MLRVLLVDRDARRIDRVHARLEAVHGRDLDLQVEGRTELASGWLERRDFDVVILAFDKAADWSAELSLLRDVAGPTPIVLLGYEQPDVSADELCAAGAADAVCAGDDVPEDLWRRLHSAIARWPLQLRLSDLQQQCEHRTELLESVLAVIDRPVLISSPAGEVTNASPHCADLFSGYAHELRGVALNDLIAQEDQSRFQSFTCGLRKYEWVEADRFRLTTQKPGQSMPIRGTAVKIGGESAWTVLAFDDAITIDIQSGDSVGAVKDVQVGLFQLLGLHDVRESLGESWSELETRVYAVVERVLGDNLMVHDHFWRNHDGDYLVLFENCDREKATQRARDLVRRIKSAVIGAHDLKAAFKNSQRLNEAQSVAIGDVRLTMNEVPLEPDSMRRHAEPFSIIEKKLHAVRCREREGLRARLASLRGQFKPKHKAARTRAGAASPLLFLDMPGHQRMQLAALVREAGDDADLISEIDAYVFDLHVDLLLHASDVAGSLAVVDVHAVGLASKRGRDHYREQCSKLPSALHGRMVLNIVGVEPGTYAPRLRQMSASLAPLTRFAGVQLTKPKADAVDLKQAGIPLVACHYADIAPMLVTRPDRFARFLRYVHDNGARLILRFVPASVERETAEKWGIDLTSSC